MNRTGVFVDAGYLFAQGSTAITGSKQRRSEMVLDVPKVIEALQQAVATQSPDTSLLRIYWYDGAQGGRMSLDQVALADSPNVKVRLGIVNTQGQQKGVDSLIVTDLVDLARNNALSDAVLLSGDEDVRIGVQIAQSFGVRVHLIGITPSRGSQSLLLIQEADTTLEWDERTVRTFLTHRPAVTGIQATPSIASAQGHPLRQDAGSVESLLDSVSARNASTIDPVQWQTVLDHAQGSRGFIAPELDRVLLGQGRAALGRDLDNHEKQRLRQKFLAELQNLVSGGNSGSS